MVATVEEMVSATTGGNLDFAAACVKADERYWHGDMPLYLDPECWDVSRRSGAAVPPMWHRREYTITRIYRYFQSRAERQRIGGIKPKRRRSFVAQWMKGRATQR